MAYFAPYIDASGLHIPGYTDIVDDLVSEAKRIFGDDIYLENDSMDYEYISVIALKMYDTLSSVMYAYNSRSPATAVGSGLDAVVKINGLKRKSASYSTCVVTIAGMPQTVIKAGEVQDIAGNNWKLPENITIPASGELDTTAVCTTIGAITALIGDINKIATPQLGWTSVTNKVKAVEGQPVETDAELRERQAVSTALPSQTLLEGTIAGIIAVEGVTRQRIYENDTNDNSITDNNPYGLPAHSITAVVEGGTDENVAEQIYLRKGIGCYTNGTTEVEVINKYDITTPIRFYRPTYIPIYVTVNIKKYTGYTDNIPDIIKNNISDYLNSLNIGDDLSVSLLWNAALTANPVLTSPIFSVLNLIAGKNSVEQNTTDIEINFNEVAQSNIENIIVNVS
ncbi:baseplate J/gp47 family protein [Megamonas hypermegale]|uniref:baseplate J/gp47 family protein n=1 Tax=Megamonas hypermegale TaxID=158847 RepID=UPI0026F2639B|nr:baseplate J/gp47 family protein [Megamonas hypermegale]